MERKFLDRAIELSRLSGEGGGPFGAVVVRAGEIIAEGINRVVETDDPTAHAEITAIRRACARLGRFDLSDCELYSSCEPCPMCLGAIYWARPAEVHFANTRHDAAGIGFDDSFIYEQLELSPGQRSIPFEHHPDAAALTVFRQWRQRPDRARY